MSRRSGRDPQLDQFNATSRRSASSASRRSEMNGPMKNEMDSIKLKLLQQKLERVKEKVQQGGESRRPQELLPVRQQKQYFAEPLNSVPRIQDPIRSTRRRDDPPQQYQRQQTPQARERRSQQHPQQLLPQPQPYMLPPAMALPPANNSRRPTNRFEQYMEMMVIQQTQTQNMIMNQLLLKSAPNNPYPLPPIYPHYPQNSCQPHRRHHHHHHHHPRSPSPCSSCSCCSDSPPCSPEIRFATPPDPEIIYIEKKPDTPQLPPPYPFPGNEGQTRIRQLGYAALFCHVLDKEAKMQKFRPSDQFQFRLKVEEVINGCHRLYLADEGKIYPLLQTTIASENEFNFRVLAERTTQSTAEETAQATQDLNYTLENLTYFITEIMPREGILGTNRKSGVFDMIRNFQMYPAGYFYTIDRELIQLDGNQRTIGIGDVQAMHLIVGVFFVRALVVTMLQRPVQYGVVAEKTPKIEDNIRIVSSIYVYIYRKLIGRFVAEEKGQGKKATIAPPPQELTFLMSDSELMPVINKVKVSIDYCETTILAWAREYVSRLRGAAT